jgi:hypothetical protein
MVPERKGKKGPNSSASNASGDHHSLSPSSPMELRMNVSGNFSDFMSSDEEGSS